MDGPILVIAYKNHSLDQFIEGCLEFCKIEDIARLGGQSKSEKLSECTIHNLRKEQIQKRADFYVMIDSINLRCDSLVRSFNRLQKAMEGIVDSKLIEDLFYDEDNIEEFLSNNGIQIIKEVEKEDFKNEELIEFGTRKPKKLNQKNTLLTDYLKEKIKNIDNNNNNNNNSFNNNNDNSNNNKL